MPASPPALRNAPCGTWLPGVLSLLAGAALVSPIRASEVGSPSGWQYVWGDEFEGETLDTSKWDPILWTTPYNNERQAYLPEQVTVADGNLVLTAIDTPYGNKPYRSGKVESKFVQQHGRWEIRAKLPGTLGTWPAIWLLPDTTQHPWPSQGEIDVMENRGNQPLLTSSAFHYGANPAVHRYVVQEQQTSSGGTLQNYHTDFHVYAVEWDAQKVRFFVDDVNHYTFYNSQVAGSLQNQTAPMETVLNVAVGGDFLGTAQPDATSNWPQSMLVDYVRVYERAANPPPQTFRNGDFEEQGGSLAGWSTFGSTIVDNPNVQVHDQAVLSGDASLKLFGQFNGRRNFSGISQGISVTSGDRIQALASSFIRSDDSIADTGNRVQMKVEFYRDFGGQYATDSLISEVIQTIAEGSAPEDQWQSHQIATTAPPGAVEARLTLLFEQPRFDTGAVHIDHLAFRNLDLQGSADADGDGRVTGADLLRWQTWGTSDASGPSQGDYNFDRRADQWDAAVWESQFGQPAPPPGQVASVPEPSPLLLAAATAAGWLEFRFGRLLPLLNSQEVAP